MELNWLQGLASAWRAWEEQGRPPHALILQGSAGVGKRCAAVWIARRRLGIGTGRSLPDYPCEIPAHPDLRWISPAEDKEAIAIAQIRDLVTDLSLTSFAGGGKVAVIEPANAMTINAANSLLKTLEEPPGDALLMLVVDQTGRLPATVVSRCQRIHIPLPAQSESLRWLGRLKPGTSWPEALRVAGHAPLAAIAAVDRPAAAQSMGRDLADLSLKKATALDVAARWQDYDTGFVLDWLCREVQRCIAAACGADSSPSAKAVGDSVLKRMDRRNLFCYLDTINRLRCQPAGSFNVRLTLESLLIDWAGDLRSCEQSSKPASPLAVSTTR